MEYEPVITGILDAIAFGTGHAAGADRIPYVVGIIPNVVASPWRPCAIITA
jgi:hypothetical protein